MSRKSRPQKELEATAAFLCLDYLATIMPPDRIISIGLEIEAEFLPYKTRSWRTRKRRAFKTDNIALILERVIDHERGRLRLNARIIGKHDRDPLKKVVDPSWSP